MLKSLDNKKAALERRIKRNDRQQQIREAAANENKDLNEQKMNENFLAQKFWSAFLKMKMQKEQAKSKELEDALQTIKSQTGLIDVQMIVQRFLTREATYSQLLQTVSENEEKLDCLRKENEEVTSKLAELQMHDADERDVIEEGAGETADPEIHQLHIKI